MWAKGAHTAEGGAFNIREREQSQRFLLILINTLECDSAVSLLASFPIKEP